MALKPLTFPPELYKRLVPSQYLQQHLSSDPPIRPDGRKPTQFRDLAITTNSLSNTQGSAVVRNGETTMVCGVRAETIEPDAFTPKQGTIVCNIEIGPLCHASVKAGPPTPQQQSITHQLQQIIETYDVVDLEALCIEPGKAAWILYVDIVCLSSSGSLLSTAYTAMIAALSTTSLPVARWDVDRATPAVRCKRELVPLKLNAVPYLVEFTVFGTHVLADPTDDETELAEGVILVIMNTDGSLLGLRKSGARRINTQQVLTTTELCQDRVQDIHKLMHRKRHFL